jgi:hypothetical protein
MPYPLSTSSPLAYLGIGRQTLKGTGVVPTLFVPYRGAISLDHGQAGEAIHEGGTGPYMNRMMKSGHDPAGQFGLGCRPNTFAELAAYFLGTDTISGASVPYLHTLTPNVAARPVWLSIEQAAGTDGDIIERFIDGFFKSMTIAVEGNNDMIATFGWESLTAGWIATAGTPTYETGVNGVSAGANMRASDIAYTIDGDAEVNVESFEVALEWAFDAPRLSRVVRDDVIRTELSGTVKLKQLINDADTVLAYRRGNYGTNAGTAPSANFSPTGSFVALADNGLTTTNEREIGITVPAIDWTSIKRTDLDPAGQSFYLEREGTIKKGAGAFVTLPCRTVAATTYLP